MSNSDEKDREMRTVSVIVREVEILPRHGLARTRVRERSVTLPRLSFLEGDENEQS